MKELLRIRAFVLVWAGQFASGLGGMFATFLEGWLVYELTGSKLAMGALHTAYLVPLLTVQLLVGPFLDRWDLRKVMIASEWIRAVAYLFPAVMLTWGWLEPWHLFVSAVFTGITEPLFRPATMAYVPAIVPKEKLIKANSLLEGTMSFALLIGPPAAGLLLVWWDPQYILYLLVSLMGTAGLVLWFLPCREGERATVQPVSWFRQFREGAAFFKTAPVLLGTGLLILLGNMSFSATNPMFLPYVTDVLNGSSFQVGLLFSTYSLGILAGSMFMGWIPEPKRKKNYILGANLIMGSCLGLLSVAYWYPLALLLAVVSGFFGIWFNILNSTLYQRMVPEQLRGRVFALRLLMAQGGMPIGAMFGGVIAESWGVMPLFAIAGSMVVTVTIIAWFLPVFAKLNQEWEAPNEQAVS
ncbi:MFS transporter [Desmospora profundinema]|uniref:MFS family permease n=1 Tax=Desmospora profundinema TaxID=1571184 RepID=A0ABU1IM51_9BACL|nr:MFS transporter [Desmospora profundinema]MDR6225859.1 MFS family permease [Desmospora profundinema]